MILLIAPVLFSVFKHSDDTFKVSGIVTAITPSSLTVTTVDQSVYEIPYPKNTTRDFKVHDKVDILAKGNTLETYPTQIEQVLSIKRSE